jgi:hypothetical protein
MIYLDNAATTFPKPESVFRGIARSSVGLLTTVDGVGQAAERTPALPVDRVWTPPCADDMISDS